MQKVGGEGFTPPPSLRTLNFSCIEEETDRRKDTGRSWGTYLNDAQAIYQQGWFEELFLT